MSATPYLLLPGHSFPGLGSIQAFLLDKAVHLCILCKRMGLSFHLPCCLIENHPQEDSRKGPGVKSIREKRKKKENRKPCCDRCLLLKHSSSWSPGFFSSLISNIINPPEAGQQPQIMLRYFNALLVMLLPESIITANNR